MFRRVAEGHQLLVGVGTLQPEPLVAFCSSELSLCGAKTAKFNLMHLNAAAEEVAIPELFFFPSKYKSIQ